jgi:ABC-type transport system substrate-binding protein
MEIDISDDLVNKAVEKARAIMDEAAREKEYQSLEAKIVQEDAAWIPLFSKERHFFVSDRVGDFTVSWNGWFEPCYKFMSLRNT